MLPQVSPGSIYSESMFSATWKFIQNEFRKSKTVIGHLFWRCLGPKWTSPKGSVRPCQACQLIRFKVYSEDADRFWLCRLEQLALFILGHHPRAVSSSSPSTSPASREINKIFLIFFKYGMVQGQLSLRNC